MCAGTAVSGTSECGSSTYRITRAPDMAAKVGHMIGFFVFSFYS